MRFVIACMRPNENKMSDGGRMRASLGMNVWKSSQKWSAQRSAVRSIAWLDLLRSSLNDFNRLLFLGATALLAQPIAVEL
jgi:hypothetical protein